MSLYHGDFEKIGHQLAERTNGFKDFTILTNVPYGVQSATAQKTSVYDTQTLYRRFGKFIRIYLKEDLGGISPQTNSKPTPQHKQLSEG